MRSMRKKYDFSKWFMNVAEDKKVRDYLERETRRMMSEAFNNTFKNGVQICSAVVERKGERFDIVPLHDVSGDEDWRSGKKVNLEREIQAACMNDSDEIDAWLKFLAKVSKTLEKNKSRLLQAKIKKA